MMTGMDKMFAALLTSLVSVLSAVGVNIPAWVTSDWITAAIGVIVVPLAVYWIPNKTQ